MRISNIVVAVLGSMSLLSVSSTALAGACGSSPCAAPAPAFAPAHCGPAPCAQPVDVRHFGAPSSQALTIGVHQPLGNPNNRFQFNQGQNVSITRLYNSQNVNLSDAPSQFTGGCKPQSTEYCRGGVSAAPIVAAPVLKAPVAHRPHLNPNRFASRQYGDNTFTPGIAHIPTSRVDRSWKNAQAVLNSGRARPQPFVSGGNAPHPSLLRSAPAHRSTFTHAAPVAQPLPSKPGAVIASPVAADGTYWEKVSGPTQFGDVKATEILCKRQLPRQVVNPVIDVPVPVCNVHQHGGAPVPLGHGPLGHGSLGHGPIFPRRFGAGLRPSPAGGFGNQGASVWVQ